MFFGYLYFINFLNNGHLLWSDQCEASVRHIPKQNLKSNFHSFDCNKSDSIITVNNNNNNTSKIMFLLLYSKGHLLFCMLLLFCIGLLCYLFWKIYVCIECKPWHKFYFCFLTQWLNESDFNKKQPALYSFVTTRLRRVRIHMWRFIKNRFGRQKHEDRQKVKTTVAVQSVNIH